MKKNKTIKILLSLLAVFTVNSCASIVGDNTRTICVNSTPPGAGIYIEGQRHGTTPASITLPQYIYGGRTVTLKKEGYHDQSVQVNTKFQPCGLWNLLFGPAGLPGFLIDGAIGTTVKIDPTSLNIQTSLDAVKPAAQTAPIAQ